jgi:hypothetical protein
MTDERELYKPGDTVPESGIYDVFHDSLDGHEHAHLHEVTAIRGMRFPPCRACHAYVRFRLQHPADHVDTHDLFQS